MKSIEIKLQEFPEGFEPDSEELTKAAQKAVEEELRVQLVKFFSKTSWSRTGLN